MRTAKVVCAALVLVVATTGLVPAQEASAEKQPEPWLRFGPRIGVTGVVSTWEEFDENIQDLYPANRDYFPVYSAVGFAIEQSIRLSPRTAFVLREVWLRSGYEQSVAFPSLIVTAGLRMGDRLELFVGPEWTHDFYRDSSDEMPYLALGLGAMLRPWGARIPVTLTVVPLSEDWKPRITLMAGLDFHLPRPDLSLWRASEEDPPRFNY